MGAEFCLGTVQMGLKYGIRNEIKRQPSEAESKGLLVQALQSGIKYFDTACSYGKSEEILGDFGLSKHGGQIITKLPPNLPDEEDAALDSLRDSLRKLRCNSVDGCLLHRMEDFYKERLWNGLSEAKRLGWVRHIGVSVYEPEEAVAAAKSGLVDYIQVPYNVIDQRLDRQEFFHIAHNNGVRVFARSSFLQGLLLMEDCEFPADLQSAKPYVDLFQRVASAYGYNPREAALLYVLSHPGIDFVVFGVDNLRQLKENTDVREKLAGFDACRRALTAVFRGMSVPQNILNPSQWFSVSVAEPASLFSLAGKTVVITGGAGHLGSAMSEALAAAGANLFVMGYSEEKNAKKAAELKKRYNLRICESITFDLSDTSSAKKAVAAIIEKTGRLDVLINNATYTSPATVLEEYTDEGWCKAIEGTINGVARMIRLVLPQMLAQGNGNIINIGSMYGMVAPNMEIYGTSGQNNPANYGAGKAAIIQLTKYVACVYGGRGIRANSVSPGPFPAPAVQENQEFIAQLSRKNPLGRIGRPEDLRGIIVYLASDASAYTNGQNIAVDGGWTAW